MLRFLFLALEIFLKFLVFLLLGHSVVLVLVIWGQRHVQNFILLLDSVIHLLSVNIRILVKHQILVLLVVQRMGLV